MPTNRRRKTRAIDMDLLSEQLCHLAYGLVLQGVNGFKDPFFPFKNDKQRKDLYFEYKDTLYKMREPEKPDAYFEYEGNKDD